MPIRTRRRGDAPSATVSVVDPEGLTRRRLLIVGGGLALAAVVPRRPAWAAAPGVPTFESLHGRALGSTQATTAELDDYVQRVAAASPRVHTELLAGRSVQGREIRLAIVSHPDNLARLGDLERRIRALRLRPPAPATTAREARSLPAFVVALANVHGNEPSGADALAQLLYELAARTDAGNERRLRELVVVLGCVQNPDGREASQRTNANGFDLNRDWFARTQPETPGKIALYNRFPPVLGLDLHEQFGSPPDTFFFPPDNDPVHHEASRAGLAASSETFTPAMEHAFKAKGYAYEHYGIYDVFYPGYGDVAPNQAWGAAGVLFEMENANAYPEKVARHLTAADAALTAAAEHKDALLGAWAAQWPDAAAQGRRGALAPNRAQNPASPAPARVPGEAVYGYALRTSAHAADAAQLVERLRAFDVACHVLTRPLRLRRLRPFGAERFGPATLGRGTVVVLTAQPLKHWVHILLADDPFPAIPHFYDVSGWSNPALMALQGGAIGEPLTALLRRPKRTRGRSHVATLRAVDRPSELLRPVPVAPAYAFALDAAHAQAAAFALLADGVEVRRTVAPAGGLPAGSAVVAGEARGAVLAAARRFGVRAAGLGAIPGDATVARRPRVALLRDASEPTVERRFATSFGFARWVLAERLGLEVSVMRAADIEAGALATGIDAFVVPDGLSTVVPAGLPNVTVAPPGGGLSPAALAAVRAFVESGGTFCGWRALGVAVAVGAQIAGTLATRTPPRDFLVPGLPVAIELRGGGPAVRGLGAVAWAFNVADPILTGGGATFAAYADAGPRALGYAEGLSALRGTVAGTQVDVGRGRSYVMAFDPAYRGFAEGTQRLLGNALLEPPRAAPTAARATPRRAAEATRVEGAARPTLVRVAAADAAAFRTALASLRALPSGARVTSARDGGLELRAVDPDPLSGHTAAWVRELLAALQRAGVAPRLVVA
jgi:Zinc carboxypeptidase